MSITRRGPSETPDGDLDLHQTHCRYTILWGADMKEANRLWEVMKGRQTDRGAHLAALSLRMGLPTDVMSADRGISESTTIDNSSLVEWNPYRHLAIRYERSRVARNECIKVHGHVCAFCGFDFGSAYGPNMEDFILVHHLEMISLGRGSRAIDPARDMRHVCANCHYVIHHRSPPYTIEEVRRMVNDKDRG